MDSQTNVVVQAPLPARQEPSTPLLSGTNLIPQMSDKGYQVVQAIIDPNAIYLDKLTAFLYSAHLTKSPVYDAESPVPGYKLTKIGGKDWKPNMSQTGYSTTVSEVLMALSEDGSVTRFPDEFKLQFYAARQTMAIIGMMIANREEWEFTNYSIIYPFGLTLWKAIVATLSRSVAAPGKTTLMDKLIHPLLFALGDRDGNQQPKNKYFNF